MKSILVIDDDESSRALVLAYLRRSGHEIQAASSGREGLDLAKQKRFDVVLMDMLMPEMDGFETTRLFRRQEQELGQSPCKIIALTGFTEAEELEQAIKAGCDRHLAKPVSKPDLLKAIEES